MTAGMQDVAMACSSSVVDSGGRFSTFRPQPAFLALATARIVTSITRTVGITFSCPHLCEESRTKLAGTRADAGAWKILPNPVSQPAVNVKYVENAWPRRISLASRARCADRTGGAHQDHEEERRSGLAARGNHRCPGLVSIGDPPTAGTLVQRHPCHSGPHTQRGTESPERDCNFGPSSAVSPGRRASRSLLGAGHQQS
jgi:hypothetical protein